MAADPRKDINLAILATLGVIGVLLVVVTVIATQAWVRKEFHKEVDVKVVNVAYDELEQLKHQQEVNLVVYRWVDQKNRIATIPIDKAIEHVAQRYSTQSESMGHEAEK